MSALINRVSIVRIFALTLLCAVVLAATPSFASADGGHGGDQGGFTTDVIYVEDVIALAVADLDLVWDDVFANDGLVYSGTDVVLYEYGVQTACGDLGGDNIYGMYCGADATIYLSTLALTDIGNSYGSFAVAVAIADLWGYYIQDLLGVSGSADFLDVQATCLAGSWAWFAADAGLVSEDDLAGALAFYENMRDGDLMVEFFIFGYETDAVADCFA